MSESLRVLSPQGKQKFINYLNSQRTGLISKPPISEFDYSPWSLEFVPAIKIEDVTFQKRTELGKYLVGKFEEAHVDRSTLVLNQGMWSWLALLWFDQLCPIIGEKRRIREDARYVCSTDWRDYYRHLVAASWMLYDMHREYSKLFLESPLYIHNDFIEQVASSQDIVTNKPLVNAISLLYWDNKLNQPKKNASNRRTPGNVRRLIAVARQISLTYDLKSMSTEQINNLLGIEFKKWKSPSGR